LSSATEMDIPSGAQEIESTMLPVGGILTNCTRLLQNEV